MRMSRPRAPTAMRMPISRVRSVTLTSMMFMMPTPPTISEMPATEAIIIPQRADDDAEHVGDLGHVADDEVVGLAGMNMVPLGQKLRDFVLCVGQHGERPGRAENRVDVVELRALQPLADGGVGHQEDVVLILADHVGPLGLQHADDAERNILHADRSG